jgi:hypothetical protein
MKYVTCDTCGRTIPDTAEDNAHYNVQPVPCGEGIGMCKDCVDWASHTVFDRHIELVAENLNPLNRQKFLSMPFSKQCWVVLKLTEKGILTWSIG